MANDRHSLMPFESDPSYGSVRSSTVSVAEESGFWRGLWGKMSSDFFSYLSEYGLRCGDTSGEIRVKSGVLACQINDYDVVVISKVGCGFCERAKVMLAEQNRIPTLFSQETVIGTDSVTRAAVSSALGLADITFPQIIIRGIYVGGCDNLRELISSGEFARLVRGEKVYSSADLRVPWYPPLEAEALTPKLLLAPSVTPSKPYPWACFQWYMYSNLVRYVSIFHSLLLLAALLLSTLGDNDTSSSISRLVNVILYVLIYDLTAIVLHAPAPFSISGTIGTYIGWKYRGNITSSLPYKFVFAIYISSLLPLLVHNKTTSKAAIAVYTSELINSSVLVVFRF